MQTFLMKQYSGALLFMLGGAALTAVLLAWARGSALRITDPYSFHVSFANAPGIEVGTPLRLKGVAIGSVKSATADLYEAKAEVQVFQRSSRIPAGSSMVFNRAGPLSPSAFIDVVLPAAPQDLSVDIVVDIDNNGGTTVSSTNDASHEALVEGGGDRFAAVGKAVAGPDLVEACRAEGVLLCANDLIQGRQGGGMDELTALMLRSVGRSIKRGGDPQVLPPHLRPT